MPDNDIPLNLTIKAAVISSIMTLPAIGYARSFIIDPLLQYGGGGPKWRWPVPWPGTREDLAAELVKADNALNRAGYCGPDDRGAYFGTTLCLAWPSAHAQIFEGQMGGELSQLNNVRKGTSSALPGYAEYFVPAGELVTVANLDGGLCRWNLDRTQAVHSLCEFLRGSSQALEK